jgi:hypothetical protein
MSAQQKNKKGFYFKFWLYCKENFPNNDVFHNMIYFALWIHKSDVKILA